MPRIHQLPQSVVTKIAAGEVIERPASVVKELLENAIDAGSRRIDLDIEEGGAELIRVVDDGCGILADDLPRAFASHATSKLGDADDLFRVRTLGFRGEALASIGGVAQVTLQSRPGDQPCGAEISCHGGQLSSVRPWNGSPGTRLEVRHLFFNTPVRRKFLRTTSTEMGHISEAFTRIALSHAELNLTLRHNDKDVYQISRSASLLDRLGLFFGAELRDQLYHVEAQQGPVRLHGYIGDPSCERGTAKMQYLFVNGRWIRDRSLGHALQEAYRGLLMSGRYAVAFLFLDVPADQIDVNVHPTKVEVRFRDSQALYHLLFGAVRDRMRAQNLTARLQPPFRTPSAPWEEPRPMPTAARAASFPSGPVGQDSDPVPTINLNRANPLNSAPVGQDSNAVRAATGLESCPTALGFNEAEPRTAAPSRPVVALPPEYPPLPASRAASSWSRAIQLYDSYLVLETEEGMLVIDQHALHERILFEELKARLGSGSVETQRLLIPEPVDLTAEQAARTLEQRNALAALGLGIEDFGGGTVLLTAYPAVIGNRSPQAVLRAVVDHLCSKERLPNREQMLNDLLSLMACHAAVKAGDRLTPDQIDALLAQRHLAQDIHHCPHGRPTALLFSRKELDRQFRRV
jgi:DNA mismatch repair protein MutL